MTYHLNNGSLFLKTDIKNDFLILGELVIWKILFIRIYRHSFNVISPNQKRNNFGIHELKNVKISEFAMLKIE